MLKGQLSVGFMARTAVGFILVIGLAYAVLSMSQSLKKDAQKQTLVSTARFVAVQVLNSLEDLENGQTINKTLSLPTFRDEVSTPYGVSLENNDGVIYIKTTSLQWDLESRHPLYLNATHVQINDLASYPPKLCIQMTRNNTYQINITC
ncbi:hypothetical protein K8R43_03910 [archaeon]|nr:hypothetical protein [archaeon]